MKKQKIFNVVMVVLIAIIVTSGVLTVGSLKGWFTKSEETVSTVEQVAGVVSIQRGGVAYRLEENTALLTGDVIETYSNAWVQFDGSVLGEKSELGFGTDGIAELTKGGVFSRQTALNLMDCAVEAENAVYFADAQTGSAGVKVLAGTVTVTKDGKSETVNAGQQISILDSGMEVSGLNATSLNDFIILQAKKATEKLCFSVEELDKVLADREEERLAAANAVDYVSIKDETKKPGAAKKDNTAGDAENTSAGTKPTETASNDTQPDNTQPNGTQPDNTKPDETQPNDTKPDETKPNDTKPDNTQPDNTKPDNTQPSGTKPEPSKPEESQPQPIKACTIQIRCDTILDNWNNLDPDKSGFVPANGCILATTTVEFEDGETVFEVLKRVCNYYGIQLEYSWTPMYNSYYIEGINNLYEFDCGSESGWMYKVNGWFPNYGCSAYTLSDGDVIVWCYTCNGLGADVGCDWMR